MQLYEKRLAGESLLGVGVGWPQGETPGRLALALAQAVTDAFGEAPTVYHSPGGRLLTMLFSNVGLLWEDLTADFGILAASLSAHWPVTFYGTTPLRETGEGTFIREGERLCARKRCVSGRDFEELTGLCVRIQTPQADLCAALAALLSRLQPEREVIALPRTLEGFCAAQCLGRSREGCAMCYVSLREELQDRICLDSLTLADKAALWEVYLSDGLSPKEFDTLLQAYLEGEDTRLLEWELTLQTALESLGMAVVNQQERFSVRDAQGRALRLDYAQGSAAEKMFLKLLFPVRPAGGPVRP